MENHEEFVMELRKAGRKEARRQVACLLTVGWQDSLASRWPSSRSRDLQTTCPSSWAHPGDPLGGSWSPWELALHCQHYRNQHAPTAREQTGSQGQALLEQQSDTATEKNRPSLFGFGPAGSSTRRALEEEEMRSRNISVEGEDTAICPRQPSAKVLPWSGPLTSSFL